MNRTEEKVRRFIEKYELLPARGGHVIVGVSGGADSTALLRILCRLRETFDLEIHGVHVEHGIRGKESREDAAFTEELCRKWSVPLTICPVDAPAFARERSESLEEAARELRYHAFREAKRNWRADARIAVAHHMDDNAETMLFQMIRGTGWRGISGLAPRKDDIIRPLLCLERSEIETYLREAGQEWRTDRTNGDDSIPRNRIRHEILPTLREINPAAVRHMAFSALTLQELGQRMDGETGEFLKTVLRTPGISGDPLDRNERELCDRSDVPPLSRDRLRQTEDSFLRREGIRQWLCAYMDKGGHDLGEDHIRMAERLAVLPGNREYALPHGYRLFTTAHFLFLEKTEETERRNAETAQDSFPEEQTRAESPEQKAVRIPSMAEGESVSVVMDRVRLTFTRVSRQEAPSDFPSDVYTKYLDYDMIKNNLVIRTRRPGDFILTGNGRQKLRRYMIDQKIPKECRDRVLLLAGDSRIYWIVGYRISEDAKVNERTKQVLMIRWRKEHE